MQVRSYLPEEKRRRKRRRAYIWLGIALLILYFIALAGLWILFRSPLFRVDRIVVQGNSSVPSSTIISLAEAAVMPAQDRGIVKPIIGFRSMFVWPSSIPSGTLAWIPQLSSLKIDKDYFFHTITITVTERAPLGIWCFMPKGQGDERCLWFDDTGDMFQRTYDTQGSVIDVVHDYSQKATGVNQKILPDVFVSNLISIVKTIRAAHVNVNAIALNDLSLEEVDITTLNGPSLYFSLRFPADNYLQALQEIMVQPTVWDKLSYIDCRTQNRVYYK